MSNLVLDPWPAQPYQHGGRSAGNTGYKLPPMAGAQAFSLWLGDLAAVSGYIYDARDLNPTAYWVANEQNANGGQPGVFRGAPNEVFGFTGLLGKVGKLYCEANAGAGFSQGLTLGARYSGSDFLPAHFMAQIRVFGRRWTLAEQADPRGTGPSDSLLAVYDFSDVSGGLLKDVSGNGRHAKIVGAPPVLF